MTATTTNTATNTTTDSTDSTDSVIGRVSSDSTKRLHLGRILNLTRNEATADQRAAGLVDLQEPELKAKVVQLLTFNEPPIRDEMEKRAAELLRIPKGLGYQHIMIGGAPFFMTYLEIGATLNELTAWYAFSVREVTEHIDAFTGESYKVSTFKHRDFIPATTWKVIFDGWHGGCLANGPWPFIDTYN